MMKIFDVSLWCDCTQLTEYELIKDSWYGDKKEFKCPKCNKHIIMEVSIIVGVER